MCVHPSRIYSCFFTLTPVLCLAHKIDCYNQAVHVWQLLWDVLYNGVVEDTLYTLKPSKKKKGGHSVEEVRPIIFTYKISRNRFSIDGSKNSRILQCQQQQQQQHAACSSWSFEKGGISIRDRVRWTRLMRASLKDTRIYAALRMLICFTSY